MNLNKVFIDVINENRLNFYRAAKAILKNEDDVEDAIQDALETAYKNIYTLKEPKYFKTWMMRILINKCYDILRKKSRVVPIESDTMENMVEEHDFTSKVEMNIILDNVDPNLREIIILFYFNNYKQDEIAKVLDIPRGTVKSRLHRARQELIYMINNNNKWDV